MILQGSIFGISLKNIIFFYYLELNKAHSYQLYNNTKSQFYQVTISHKRQHYKNIFHWQTILDLN